MSLSLQLDLLTQVTGMRTVLRRFATGTGNSAEDMDWHYNLLG